MRRWFGGNLLWGSTRNITSGQMFGGRCENGFNHGLAGNRSSFGGEILNGKMTTDFPHTKRAKQAQASDELISLSCHALAMAEKTQSTKIETSVDHKS